MFGEKKRERKKVFIVIQEHYESGDLLGARPLETFGDGEKAHQFARDKANEYYHRRGGKVRETKLTSETRFDATDIPVNVPELVFVVRATPYTPGKTKV